MRFPFTMWLLIGPTIFAYLGMGFSSDGSFHPGWGTGLTVFFWSSLITAWFYEPKKVRTYVWAIWWVLSIVPVALPIITGGVHWLASVELSDPNLSVLLRLGEFGCVVVGIFAGYKVTHWPGAASDHDNIE